MQPFSDPVPVVILTGFLGSGKTTLLASLVKEPEMANAAVIINEFGEIGLDHALVEHTDGNVIELESGCICCTVQSDLIRTLEGLVRRRSSGKGLFFDRVIIETTGLADPVALIHMLMTSPSLLPFFRLDRVVTVVDAANGAYTLDTCKESLKQAAMADTLVLSKTDLVTGERRDALLVRLHALNPGARVLIARPEEIHPCDLLGATSYDPAQRPEEVRSWLQAEAYDHREGRDHHHHSRHEDGIQSFALTHDQPVARMAFELFLNAMAGAAGPQLLRLKGLVNVVGEERPAVVHGVQHIFHPVQWLERWPDADRRSRLVFITRGIAPSEVRMIFRVLVEAVDEVEAEEAEKSRETPDLSS